MGRKGDSKRKPKQVKSLVNSSGSVASGMQAAERMSIVTREADNGTKKNGTDRKKSSK